MTQINLTPVKLNH